MYKIMMIAAVLMSLNGFAAPANLNTKNGTASYYHDKFIGRLTSTGARFLNSGLTAASNHFPLNTLVRVTNLRNHRVLYVLINDHMSPRCKRLIDLTSAAAHRLGYHQDGLAPVRVEPVAGSGLLAFVRRQLGAWLA